MDNNAPITEIMIAKGTRTSAYVATATRGGVEHTLKLYSGTNGTADRARSLARRLAALGWTITPAFDYDGLALIYTPPTV